jgi:hypothetical protein
MNSLLGDAREYYYKNFPSHLQEFLNQARSAHSHNNEEISIPVGEFRSERIAHIPKDQQTFFVTACICTFLIDQLIFSHFKNDYPLFKTKTQYPKLELGITGVNLNPWTLTRFFEINEQRFETFIQFYIEDLRDFFSKETFSEASWDGVKKALMTDKDVGSGYFGERFLKFLETGG